MNAVSSAILVATILPAVATILAATSCTNDKSDRESDEGSSRIRPGALAPVVQPDLSSRPLRFSVERQMDVPADLLFQAWTSVQFDRWFAAPGTVLMKPEINSPYFFEARFEGERHPHYGRFLELKTDRLVKMTWVTADGTRGVETIVTVESIASGDGTLVRLTQEGFPDEQARDGHQEAWPMALEELENALSTSN